MANLILFLLVLFSFSASAETIPAVTSGRCVDMHTQGRSPEAACAAMGAINTAREKVAFDSFQSNLYTQNYRPASNSKPFPESCQPLTYVAYCSYDRCVRSTTKDANGIYPVTCSTASNVSVVYSDNSSYVGSGLTCPSGKGYTLVGSNCVRPDCTADQIRSDNGQCINKPKCGSAQFYQESTNTCICPQAGTSAMIGGAVSWSISGSASSCVSGGASYGGCAMQCSNGHSYKGGAACAGCSFSGVEAPRGASGEPGQTASPVGAQSNSPKTVQDIKNECVASAKGYVETNGVVSCVNATDAPGKFETVYELQKSSTKNGVSDLTKVSSSTVCDSGNCTNTTTTSNSAGTETAVTKGSGSTYCQSNPTDPICSKEQQKTDCDKYPDSAGCASLGDAPTVPDTGTLSLGVSSISPVNFGGSKGCPADQSVNGKFNWSYRQVCDHASMMRPIILALAWLSAAFIVLGFKGSSSDG